jgi:hypothetical protein
MTYRCIDLLITFHPFTGIRRLAAPGAAAMSPPLLAAAGAADAAPKQVSP